MKASLEWLAASSAEFSAGSGRSGMCPSESTIRLLTGNGGKDRPWSWFPVWRAGSSCSVRWPESLRAGFGSSVTSCAGKMIASPFGGNSVWPTWWKTWRSLSIGTAWNGPTLLGVSFGGVLGLEFAARYPGRLRALAVQGAGANFDLGLLQRVAGMVLSRYPLPPDNPFINQFFNLLFGGRQEQGPMFQFVTQQCWQTDQSVMAHRFRLAEQFNLVGRLDRIRVPTLVLTGDRDLLVSDRKSAGDLAEGLPRVRLVRLDGCGHLAFITQPQPRGRRVESLPARSRLSRCTVAEQVAGSLPSFC